MPTLKTPFRYLLGAFFIAAGLNHFWHTPFYVAMMPPYLPAPLALVYLSGVAEIGLGALLLFSRWQRRPASMWNPYASTSASA